MARRKRVSPTHATAKRVEKTTTPTNHSGTSAQDQASMRSRQGRGGVAARSMASADARIRIAGVRSRGPAGPSSTGAGCAITTRTARGSSVEFMTSAVPIQEATIAASPRHATTYRA